MADGTLNAWTVTSSLTGRVPDWSAGLRPVSSASLTRLGLQNGTAALAPRESSLDSFE